MKGLGTILVFTIFITINSGIAQNIPSHEVVSVSELSTFLKPEVKQTLAQKGKISTSDLAQYFRETFSERYFYDWKNFDKRFQLYKTIYPEAEKNHETRALDHMAKYSGTTKWKLPFNYLFGDPVNAYALRHLARQHKMVDIAFYSHYQDQGSKYVAYFKDQQKSLNAALESGNYEKIEDGNGVYEAFRSGYRVLNWLQIHNMFLGEDAYTDEDQLRTIATLLQHGSHLYETNREFHSGNHQTRGVSALAMISILLRDFVDTDLWYDRAMQLLEAHLSKEINEDGFQFERTVHYHMSDIGNYYYVYQLAQISNIKVGDFWENRLRSLFSTLIKIAYPDKSAPVLSDDTDRPWAEKNDISGALTLGYLLFNDPEMGYFANDHVEAKMYWYLNEQQLGMLSNIQSKKPEYQSLHFPETGYYVMRDGWNDRDNMMIISAGLDDLKPDHQHGDMLGIQAMANGNVILPNYQVRYYLKDLELFKNSLTKNVALVDDELQGKQYTSNKGGSGFGKFKALPNPEVITWHSDDNVDVFVGTHDGFENIGVNYSRQVIYLKNDFWIVKDNFSSEEEHIYKQIWQGHFSTENGPNLIRTTFDDGSGLDIFQLESVDGVKTDGRRGKEWAIVSKDAAQKYSFITLVFPFSTFDKRIDENLDSPNLKGWKLNASKWKNDSGHGMSLTKEETSIYFSVSSLEFADTRISFSDTVDVLVNTGNNRLKVQLLSGDKINGIITRKGVAQSVIFTSTINTF
ncbi:heparinase II/III family protein [Seonamhaeicola sp.]|uniref:heparinase II/III family protein n=1 Tax=Seonamhaeicola sp. TaxID=1912245 RepID=UPI00261873B7|nr:heparinase II/III family protein [Seonamhaeicola sp.]